MHRFASVFLATAAVVAPIATTVPQNESGLMLRAVRFYRPDQNRTRVKGLVQIPFSMIRPSSGTAAQLNYKVSVRVVDSTNLTLYQQTWRNRASAVGAPDAYTVEIVDFVVAPGRYRLEVAVEDSVSGNKVSGGIDVQALSEADGASDLLVAPEMRLATADDTVPRPGEFRTGNNLVTAAAHVVLTPLRAKVYYLLEAYSDSGGSGTMSVALKDSTGKTSIKTPEVPVTVTPGGSVLKGQLDLTGLPEGAYTMAASLKLNGRSIERSATISMEGLRETLARDSARRESDRVTDPGYFGAMTTTEELDVAKAPLLYIAESGELAPWRQEMSLEAKRRFLTNFWQKRDPTPGTPRNEMRESFYEAIAYANREYKEGGRKSVAGWRSDRGRVFAKNGAPDDVLRRQNEGRAPPYEVWRYTKGKGAYYIFADRTGFGAYQLIFSNDLREPGIPSWSEVIGRKAVDDAGEFLGVDLFSLSRRDDTGVRQSF